MAGRIRREMRQSEYYRTVESLKFDLMIVHYHKLVMPKRIMVHSFFSSRTKHCDALSVVEVLADVCFILWVGLFERNPELGEGTVSYSG
jgi:hypothetical protein